MTTPDIFPPQAATHMYLSRLRMNSRSRAVRRDIADCYQLHRTLLAAFPHGVDQGARSAFKILYRVESHDGAPMIYVQSGIRPDWTCLPEDYLADSWMEGESLAVRRIDDAWAGLKAGQVLRFRLHANPTRKVDTRNGSNGRRVPIGPEPDRILWLERKATSGGFKLVTSDQSDAPDVAIRGEERSQGKGGGRPLTFKGTVFEGRLEIVDIDRFRDALGSGIGSGKAFGFGLLSIAP